MSVRRKLNAAHVWVAVLTAALAGLLTGSPVVALAALALLLAARLAGGEIRGSRRSGQ